MSTIEEVAVLVCVAVLGAILGYTARGYEVRIWKKGFEDMERLIKKYTGRA